MARRDCSLGRAFCVLDHRYPLSDQVSDSFGTRTEPHCCPYLVNFAHLIGGEENDNSSRPFGVHFIWLHFGNLNMTTKVTLIVH